MRWIDKIERKYGKYAIPNLMYYIIILYALGFVVEVASPDLYDQYLALDAQAILHGQIWRIFTFIIQPPTGSFIFIFFSLYLCNRTEFFLWDHVPEYVVVLCLCGIISGCTVPAVFHYSD